MDDPDYTLVTELLAEWKLSKFLNRFVGKFLTLNYSIVGVFIASHVWLFFNVCTYINLQKLVLMMRF